MAQGLQMPPIQSKKQLDEFGKCGKEHRQGLGWKEQDLDGVLLGGRPHVIFCWCKSKIFMNICVRELYKSFEDMLQRKNNEAEM